MLDTGYWMLDEHWQQAAAAEPFRIEAHRCGKSHGFRNR
jgi:hypothetical protein